MTTTTTTLSRFVKILESSTPPGKLADAELTFPAFDNETRQTLQSVLAITYGPEQHPARATQDAIRLALSLEGLRLIGFAIWERRAGTGRNVTFPARQYSVNGERRSFALLRPTSDVAASERIRDLVLQAYAEHEQQRVTEPPAPETSAPATCATTPPPSHATAAPTPAQTAGLF